jgi:hypothetical protein
MVFLEIRTDYWGKALERSGRFGFVPASNVPSGHAGLDSAQLVGFLASRIGSPRETKSCKVR